MKRRGKSKRRDHIGDFFAEYPEFDYDQSAEIWREFYRMCDGFGWRGRNDEKEEAKERFKSAMVLQFNDLYGTDRDDLNAWQGLCRILNIFPPPTELDECRKRVRRTHVNLVDLVDAPRTGARVEVFTNLEELQKYTIDTGKYFPKEDAYAGGLLKFLLREIFGKHKGGRQRVPDRRPG
ncbi:hypothetical protein AYL99_03091 [Fonsecaea erecta]|uniref:Uncharacterized protein n=1 Tax=Fonsecaea erecta TaxID=1367422 RepID=A0A178ZVP2_9EURO|nr:hypothetical protein AYL99_03091 [Fonsecaea erecta]OAP63864.1 hypothetical protein AYL99_03091 [Fonsecaea erecta]